MIKINENTYINPMHIVSIRRHGVDNDTWVITDIHNYQYEIDYITGVNFEEAFSNCIELSIGSDVNNILKDILGYLYYIQDIKSSIDHLGSNLDNHNTKLDSVLIPLIEGLSGYMNK